MHGTVQIFKNNNNTFVVIMIFFLIFSSVFLTHTADFCNLKGFRLKFSVCLILPYPSAALPLQAAVCALLSYQWPQLLEVFLGRGTPQLNDRKIQEEVGRLRCTEESKRERETTEILPCLLWEDTGRHTGSLSFLHLGKQNDSRDRGKWC